MNWMAALPIAIALGFIAGNGGRAQWQLARLAGYLGRSELLLLSALITSTITMALAVWLGTLAAGIAGPASLRIVAGIAICGAAAELLWPIGAPRNKEPTRSLGAISYVLLIRQMADAPRLIIFAVAAQLPFAPLFGLGCAIGMALCLWFGWQFHEMVERRFSAMVMRGALGLTCLVMAGLLFSEAASLASA